MTNIIKVDIEQKTKKSLIGSSLLYEIFIPFLGLMPFILRKDLSATAMQISIFTMIKPAVAVLSFYWSSFIIRSSKSLRNNMIIAGILARMPFLFFPFFGSVWYLIFATAVYMLFSRAAIPAWMEILKLNLSSKHRDSLFSLGSVLGYVEGVVIAFFLGSALDLYQNFWKIFLLFSTFLGFCGVYLQLKTPIFLEDGVITQKNRFQGFLTPWKEGFGLIKNNSGFARFQLGTTFSGFGLMLSIPAMALFYSDTILLTHNQLIIGRYVFMGLGFLFFSNLWAKALQKVKINFLTAFICLGFAFFPFLILLGVYSKLYIYLAYFVYGITQSGSHLVWHMSGPIFSKDEDSSKYSGINVLMVGMRGLIAPMIGGVLCELYGPLLVFFISICLCLTGAFYLFIKKDSVEEISSC